MTDPAADPHDLPRFLAAQAPVFEQVCAELRAGRKASHWMWFVFPQLAGLGHSHMARLYAIGSRAEAAAYWAHPVLGSRLAACTGLVTAANAASAGQIFGAVDSLKFRSCMTLFAAVTDHGAFAGAVRRYFGGVPDSATLDLLASADRRQDTGAGLRT